MEGDPRLGTVLGGRYRIGRKLGEGGMGAVYTAVQEPLGRKVAVKVLLPVLARDATLVSRFQREAELAASLGHPNIVQVTDFGVDDGAAFLVMDLLEGESLGAAIDRDAPLSPERVRFIATQVLSALDAAHARGVVHRDLKPDNIFLTSVSGVSDLVKLLDFGIARLTEGDGDQKMTATGQVLGTPAYMSPEQARGKPVDARSDLYALGVVMYEALSGQMPVNGSNYHELMFAIVGETPKPLLEHVPSLEPSLVAIVERAMAKDPNARYSSALEMRAALDALGPLQASSPARVVSHPPQRVATEDAMAATITPEALAAVRATRPGESVAGHDSGHDARRDPRATNEPTHGVMHGGTPAAVPAVVSSPPPPASPSRSKAWLVGALALALVGGVAAFALSRPDAPTAVAAPPAESPNAESPDESDESDESEALAAAIEAATEARAREIAERVLRETAERMEATAPPTPTLGAPDSVIAAERAEAASMAASMTEASTMEREPTGERSEPRARPAMREAASPGTRMVRCGDQMREFDVVRPGDTVNVTFRQTNNVVSMDAYRSATQSWTPQLTSCYVGHPSVGGMFTIEVDASGRITKLRRNPFCDAPPALERCLEGFLEGFAVGNDTGAPGEMRFDINHRVR